jgi:hypothetical protein
MKEQLPPNSEPTLPAAVIACAIIAAVAIIVASIGDEESTSPETWVYRYQTLIGGLAAIFAAYVTIAQMRHSDERQEARHRELVALGNRRDTLAVARFKASVLPMIDRGRTRIREFVGLFAEGEEPSWTDATYQAFQRALFAVLIIRKVLSKDTVGDCWHLMPGEITAEIQSSCFACDGIIRRTVGDADALLVPGNREQLEEWFRDGVGVSLNFILSRLEDLHEVMREWIEEELKTQWNTRPH